MPPKAKFTREEIIEAAFQLAREGGMDAVVAREVGKRLGTSSSPIFTAFANMEELQEEVRKVAIKKLEYYVQDAAEHQPPFKYIGMKMIQFATEEPNLFLLIYMQNRGAAESYDQWIEHLGDLLEMCLQTIEDSNQLSREESKKLFRQVWMLTFSICMLIAGNVCRFTEEEISEMLSLEFQGGIMLIKSGRYQPVTVQ